MRGFSEVVCSFAVACCWLAVAGGVALAQPPGPFGPGGAPSGPGGGPGGPGGRSGFGGRGGFGDPNSFLNQLRSDEFRQELSFSEEQDAELSELRREMFESFGAAFRSGTPPTEEQRTEMMAGFEARAVKIMNPQQQAVWQRRQIQLAQTAPAANGGGPSAPSQPAGPPQPARRGIIPNETAPEGDAPVVSFQAPGADGAPARDGSALMSFNFRYAPWPQVLQLFAEVAGLTIDLNDTPTGTFNYFDDHQYTVTEALDVLNGYLLPKGYALVQRDRFLVCLNLDDGIPPNMIPVITLDQLPHRGRNELVSLVIPLDAIKASEVNGEVLQLLGPQGKVAALNNTNSLYVMDVAANVQRVYDLLNGASGMARGDTAFKSIPLKHISATDAERTIRRLFGLNPTTSIAATPAPMQPMFGSPFGGGFGPPGFSGFDRSRGSDGDRDSRDSSRSSSRSSTTTTTQSKSPYADKIWVTADTRTSHLLVTASPELLRVVENAVLALDTGTDAAGNPIVNSDNPLTMKVYSVTGNATQMAMTLSLMLPGPAITDDSASSRLYIQATADEHAEIARLLSDLDGGGTNSVAVISLYRLDPVGAMNTLRNLFISEGTRAPSIEADALGRRLMIRGTPDQVNQIKALLADLGETGEGRESQEDRGNLRTRSLQGRDPADFLPLLKEMWGATSPTPIRIVVPSQAGPIKDLRVPSDAQLNVPGSTPATSRTEDVPARPTSALFQGISFQSHEPESAADKAPGSDNDVPSTLTPPAGNDSGFSDFLRSFLEGDDSAAMPATTSQEMSASGDGSPLGITVIGDEMVLTGKSSELDRMEAMLEQLELLMPVKTQWTVFYLRSADATETAQMLERLFPQSSVTTSTAQSDGILGSLTGGLSSLGRGMMDVTGLNSTLGGQSLRIITDLRSNALFVSGPTNLVAEVEQMLRLLDASELPTSLKDRIPRSIPVEYSDVDEVAAIVQNVFKDEMTASEPGGGGGRQQGGRNGGGFNPLAMMMGAAQQGGQAAQVRLTIGVDRQTSHLIVSCNDSLFRQVEDVVLDLEERARAAKPVVRIMPLATADPSVISATLGSLLPKVVVSSTRSVRREQPSAPTGGATGGSSNGQDGNSSGPSPETMRQMMEERFRSRMSGSGGDSGSSRGFGGFGGGFGGAPGGFGGTPGEGGRRGPR